MQAITWRHLVVLYIHIATICLELTQAYLVWVSIPQNQAVALGDDVVLPCQAKWTDKNDTSVTLSYRWTFNGGRLTTSSSMFFNHSLFISTVSSSDLGNYSCFVTSMQLTDGGNTSLISETLIGNSMVIEAYINPFVLDPESMEGTIGEEVVLTCITGRSAPSLQVKWLRNTDLFTDGEHITAAFGDFDTTKLSLQLSMKLMFKISAKTLGTFECVAFNEVLKIETVSGQANITMKSISSNDTPVIEWNLPQSMIIAEKQNLVLPCEVIESTEPVRIFWHLGAYEVDESKRVYVLPNNSLGFLPVGPKDGGNYSCVAKNSKGTTQSPYIQLVVAFLGISFLVNPSDVNSIYGQDVILKCSPPESIPAAYIMWYKDYLPIDLQSDRIRVIGSDLYLTSVVKSDNGLYYCVTFNNFTVPSSRTSEVARLTVEGPPIMIQPPMNTKLVKGTLLHLICLVESDPTPNTTWQFEGMALPSSNKVSLLNRGQELWITNVGKEWEGRYTCLSTNKYGYATADAFVIVLVPPMSLNPIGNLTARSGDSILIPCTVVCDPMPDIQWFFNGMKMSLEGSLAFVPHLNWTYRHPDLYISHVQAQHSGKYLCVGSNDVGNASSSGWLVVHVPPSITQGPNNVTAIIGTSLTLSCQTEGIPDAALYWLYNSTAQLPEDVQFKDNNSTLMLDALGWENVGFYTCVAYNVAGTVQATAAVKLMVPPAIENVLFPKIPVRIQTRFNLSCATSGIPTPLVQWTRSDIPIQASLNGRIRIPEMGLLVVEVAWKNDSGEYECWASSKVGQQKKKVLVVIYGEPSPPVLLRAVPLSSESVYLIWDWSDHGDAAEIVEKFQITFWERTREVTNVYALTPLKNETRVEVLGLQPSTEYMFSVSAVNDAGTGSPSNIMSAVTLQSRPFPPVNLNISALTSTSVALTWEVPTSQNGVVRLYELRYRRINDIQEDYTYVNITDPHPSNDISLSPLLPYSDYDAQVRACNIDRGEYLWGNYSSITFHTLASKPSLPPQYIQVVAVDPYSLTVTWQQIPPAAQNGPTRFYHVNVTNNQSQVIDSVKVNASVTSHAIRGLFPWRYYSVTVMGENEAGLGPISGPHGAMTLPVAPVAAPADFQASANSASSVKIYWKALQGDLVTCNITAYVVEYRKQGNSMWSSTSVPSNLSSASFSYYLEFLMPWTWYECQVAAFTPTLISGMGPFTDVVHVRTLQGVSSPVTLFSYTVNSTYILLSWQPPKDVKGVLIGYRVVFEALGSANISEVVEINTTSNMATLQYLFPDTIYNISVAAVNVAGRGQELIVMITTSPLPSTTLASTTSGLILGITSSNITERSLGQSNSSYITKHLASIVAGSIVGAIALIIITAIVCIKCMKYRQKQRLNYDVDSEIVGVEGTSYRNLESSSDIVIISSNISYKTTDSWTSTTVTQTHHDSNHSALDDEASTGGNVDSIISKQAINVKEPKKKHHNRRPSLPILLQNSSYSVLQEDNHLSYGYRDDGIENPAFIEVTVDLAEDDQAQQREENLKRPNSGQYLTVMKDDTISVSSETLRRNRMHSESAAAIAVLWNSQMNFPDDTDTLMDLESIGSEVIFNERTVL